ncbi:MAG: tetratricopeptide repeat protein [Microcoleus sp.]
MSDSINQETAAISSDEDNQLQQEGKIKEGMATSNHATELNSDSALAYYNLGETLARQWRWEEAKAAYSKAIELEPNYFEAHQKLGEAFHAVGKLEDAIASYRQAIIISSKIGVLSEELHSLNFNLGEALQRQGKFEDAIACYQKSLEFNSASARVCHHLGVALSALQRWDEVVVAVRIAVELAPDSFWSHRLLVESLTKLQKWDEAIACCRRVLELNLDFVDIHEFLWIALIQLHKWDEAVASYRQAMDLHPQRFPASHKLENTFEQDEFDEESASPDQRMEEIEQSHSPTLIYKLGQVMAQQWRWEEAIAAYSKAIELEPNYFEAHQKLGEAFHAVGKLEDAIASYRQAIIISSNIEVLSEYLGSLHFNLGEALQRQGKFEDAIACYHKSLELNSVSARVYHHLGTAMSALQRWEEATAAFKCEVELSPDLFLGHRLLAEALIKIQKWDEATACCHRALELNPDSIDVHETLWVALIQLKKWDEAVACCHNAIEMKPHIFQASHKLESALAQDKLDKESASYLRRIELNLEFRCYQLLSESLQKQNYFYEAIDAYQRVVDLQPDNSVALFNLAILLTLCGNVSEAIITYKKAVELQPNYIEPCWNLAWLLSQYQQWGEAISYCQKAIDRKPEGVLDHFQKTSKYTFVNLHSLSKNERHFLEKIGLSIEYLKLIEQDNLSWKQIFSFSKIEDISCFLNRPFIDRIIDKGYIDCICPVLGNSLTSQQSFYLGHDYNVIFYRFVGANEFYLIVGGSHTFKIGIYWPVRELIISFCDDNLSVMRQQRSTFEKWVNTFKKYAISYLEDYKSYISGNEKQKKLTAVLGGIGNISHYIWNELSGFQDLYLKKKLKKFNVFLTASHHYCEDIYLSDIFPEIVVDNPEISFVKIPAQAELPGTAFQTCLKENLFTITPTAFVLQEKLADRLYHASLKKCQKTYFKKLGQAKQNFPLIWITLRSHRRVWLSEIEGIANILTNLSKKYPSLGVVFDGMTREKANMEKIINLLPPNIKTYNALECSVYETIVWVHAIDLFIAPWGAGSVFTSIANKTGVFHGSTIWCRSEPFSINPRENGVLATSVPVDSVVDILDSAYSVPNDRNYEVDWKAIYTEAINLLKNLNYRNS